ncbi:hypothetical protein ACFE04_000249 [Oxalis oulophora]
MENTTTTASHPPAPATVQRVNKKSSDELLKKFANDDDDDNIKDLEDVSKTNTNTNTNARRVSKRIKDRRRESDQGGTALVEKKSLLPVSTTRRSSVLRKLGIGKSNQNVRAREIRNKSIRLTIEKTWRKTVQGASKVFLDKHYNRHRRLINDIVELTLKIVSTDVRNFLNQLPDYHLFGNRLELVK